MRAVLGNCHQRNRTIFLYVLYHCVVRVHVYICKLSELFHDKLAAYDTCNTEIQCNDLSIIDLTTPS